MQNIEKKISVLHIITNLPVGGAQDNTLLTVEQLNRKKFNITLMCGLHGEWVERAKAIQDIDLIFIKELVRPISLIKDLIALNRIYRIFKEKKFDIVHTHSSKPGVLGRIAAKLTGIPIVVHTIHGFPFHDFMNPITKSIFITIEKLLAKITDKLITVSKLNLEKACKLKFADRERFQNIYSGIDFKKFDIPLDVVAKKKELGIVNGQPIVGMVGRLSKQKAPLDFVRSTPKILDKHPNVKFLLVGDGELKAQTLSLAKELGVSQNIEVLGFRKDIPELLSIFDIYVLTSHWEGLGRALTEAMYTGRPVIATNVEGVPELVKDRETGLLVEPNDIEAISQAVISLLDNRSDALKYGAAAAKQVCEKFEATAMIRQIESLYQELLTTKGLSSELTAKVNRLTDAVHP